MQIVIFQQLRTKARLFLLKKLATCKEIAPVMSESLDRQLTFFEQIRMRAHMMVCKWCRNYLFQIRLIRELAVTAEQSFGEYGEPFPEAASLKLKQRLNHAIERRPVDSQS
jgi:Putative zinc-finger